MAGNNRAVDGAVPPQTPYIPPGTTIEGLPTTGLFGKSPAMAIGVIMFVVQFIVRYAIQRGYIPALPSEVTRMADDWGDDAALIFISAVSSLPALIQAYWTKFKVFSPRSVYKRYFLPLFDK